MKKDDTRDGETTQPVDGRLHYPASGSTMNGPEKILLSLKNLLGDDDIEEIMFNSPLEPVRVFHRLHGMMDTDISIKEGEIGEVITFLLPELKGFDFKEKPIFDGVLADGSRINITFPPVALRYPNFTIRKFKAKPITPLDLIKSHSLSIDSAAFLSICLDGSMTKTANILITGGAGTGKTTNLSALSYFIPLNRRIIIIEDTPELKLPHKNLVRMVSSENYTMEDLLKNALRMRPERIIIGEVRGREAQTLFNSMYTGTEGIIGTLHATSTYETVNRIKNPPMSVPVSEMRGLDLIIVCHMVKEKEKASRFVYEISEVTGVHKDRPRFNILFKREPSKGRLLSTEIPPRLIFKMSERSGIKHKEIMKEIKRREESLTKLVKEESGVDELLGEVERWQR